MPRIIKIPEYELMFSFARSGGPGGQNVNKVETKVAVSFYFQHSGTLTAAEKVVLAHSSLIKSHLNAEGAITLSSQVHRSQSRNREEVVAKLHDLLRKALEKKRKRIPTSKSKSSERQRLNSKRHRSVAKAARRRVEEGD